MASNSLFTSTRFPECSCESPRSWVIADTDQGLLHPASFQTSSDSDLTTKAAHCHPSRLPCSGLRPTHQPEGFSQQARQRSPCSMVSPPLQNSSVICPGYLSSLISSHLSTPAPPAPYCTLDTVPHPRWSPHQLAHCIQASAQISNVTLAEHPRPLPHHPISLPRFIFP